ncbi:uncharacterized protein [Macrobrachium rosenbergii]|uniref:uncharacterized protein isoform X2 n=2 Tax=Macrobrachium rosenbergii TaxID=79674 RepID=UPI0034D5E010
MLIVSDNCIFILLVALSRVWALAAKASDPFHDGILTDQLTVSRNIEICEVYNSSGIYHIIKRQSSPASLMVIKIWPSGCRAWFSGNCKWKKSEISLESSVTTDKSPSVSFSFVYLQRELKDAFFMTLYWNKEHAILELPFMEVGYFSNFISAVPQHLASPGLPIKNWRFWVNDKNSLDKLGVFSNDFNGILLNITLLSDTGSDSGTTGVRCSLESQERSFIFFSLSDRNSKTSAENQEELLQMQFPLNLNFTLKRKVKTSPSQSKKEIILRITNNFTSEFVWFHSIDVSKHELNKEKNAKFFGKTHCLERCVQQSAKELEKDCSASSEKESLFMNIKNYSVEGDLCCEEQKEQNFLHAKRIREVTQTLGKTDFFTMTSNMTVDMMSSGHYIAYIYQNLNLSVCPALSFSLKQIFNISSNFSGWEFVLNQWHWGNIVVKGHWGQSFFELYKKTFSFSFDQDIPLPNINIILDFEDYKNFVIKFACPTLASSVVTTTHIRFPVVTFEAVEQDEFWQEESIKLFSVDFVYDEDILAMSWDFSESRMKEIYRGITDVLFQVASHPKFCGNNPSWSLRKIVINMIGYNEDFFWQEVHRLIQELQEVLRPAVERIRLKEFWRLLQENLMKDSEFEIWGWMWKMVKAFNLAKERPEGNGIILRIQDWKHLFDLGKDVWKFIATKGDPNQCFLRYSLPKYLHYATNLVKHTFLQE